MIMKIERWKYNKIKEQNKGRIKHDNNNEKKQNTY